MEKKYNFKVYEVQLYNIPLPQVIICYLQNLVMSKTNSDIASNAFLLLMPSIEYLFNKRKIENLDGLDGKIQITVNVCLFESLYNAIFSHLKDITGIDYNEIRIKIPEFKPEGIPGMTDQQISDYYLGYRIVNEFFKNPDIIEYY